MNRTVRKLLGREKSPLERLLSKDWAETAIKTTFESEEYNVRLPDMDHFLDEFYGLDIETAVKKEYNEENFTSEELGSILAYEERARGILSKLGHEKALKNHADFEGIEYTVNDDLTRDMEFAEKNLY